MDLWPRLNEVTVGTYQLNIIKKTPQKLLMITSIEKRITVNLPSNLGPPHPSPFFLHYSTPY
ncbi:hypothetical protein L211DRAFT_587525 [Terfezia boudieri ATCC MYA-4762]|uniref:Uncharacterized protein n=1 Tax=Terfezia boudieri ATCC MYA-4762 TaxID=1051890 RepID=A0A3N4LEH5_9PEZI|nr:hypothetical protein L211DRAFT_587525 [Terfezia boudieri ATCC MYA-4762]